MKSQIHCSTAVNTSQPLLFAIWPAVRILLIVAYIGYQSSWQIISWRSTYSENSYLFLSIDEANAEFCACLKNFQLVYSIYNF